MGWRIARQGCEHNCAALRRALALQDVRRTFEEARRLLANEAQAPADIDPGRGSYEGRVFIGKKPPAGAGYDHDSYAGSFYVFGHGDCWGEEGHCDVPPTRDPFDLRLPHHLEPHVAMPMPANGVHAPNLSRPSVRSVKDSPAQLQ